MQDLLWLYLRSVVAITTRFVPEGVTAQGATLVSGGVVVSSDYFKTFVAGFRNLVGGRFRGFESLLERARREAILRMKQQAREHGSSLVIGVRIHTTRVAGSQTPSVEVIAFGDQNNDKEMLELATLIAQLPAEHRSLIEPVLANVLESTRRRRRILTLVQDALSQLRLDMKYLVFDLEATRRERDAYRQTLDERKNLDG